VRVESVDYDDAAARAAVQAHGHDLVLAVSADFAAHLAAGTPAAVLQEIQAQIARIKATKEFRDRVDFEGAVVLEGTSADFAALIREQAEKWGKVIRTSGIKPE